jgi:glycosyltransferase involved in cell wall biosynthesis
VTATTVLGWRDVKILLWHGYLMSGSGSNVYTLNIAAAWRRQGHDVLVMCQQRQAGAFGVVDAEGDFSIDNLSYGATETGVGGAAGTCTVVRPDIGGLLPVYVYDDYEGFKVKRYVDLDDEELAGYVDRNVTAMVTALKAFAPDAVITGHEVMGPYIAKLACEQTGHRYVAKLHGSALEYAVKLQERYLHYATEGLGGAHRVVGGSSYMLREAGRVIPGWEDKRVVVNPGVDVEIFRPSPDHVPGTKVAFVGKLIAEKGVHNLIAALGSTTAPGIEVVIVGYGGDEEAIVDLASALGDGDRSSAAAVARTLKHNGPLLAWIDGATSEELDRCAGIPITFTGRLEHGPLSQVLPTFDILVVPSIVSEAFGMVAAEAAACGVLPLTPDHSGISEAGAAVEERLGKPGLLRYDPADPIAGIAAGLDRLLSIPSRDRKEMGRAASALATERWSWDRVAEKLLEAAV